MVAIYICICVAIYAMAAFIAYDNWHLYMAGGQLVKIDNPNAFQIEEMEDVFRTRYVNLCSWAMALALIAFLLIWYYREKKKKSRHDWRRVFVFLLAEIVLYVWSKRFRLTDGFRFTGCLRLGRFAFFWIGIIIIMIRLLDGTKERNAWSTGLLACTELLTLLYSAFDTGSIISLVNTATQVADHTEISKAVLSFADVIMNTSNPGAFEIRYLIQFCIAAIPFIPIFMLGIWFYFFLPKDYVFTSEDATPDGVDEKIDGNGVDGKAA